MQLITTLLLFQIRPAIQPNGGVQQKSWTPNFRAPGQHAMSKAGSHGSLDDTYATNVSSCA